MITPERPRDEHEAPPQAEAKPKASFFQRLSTRTLVICDKLLMVCQNASKGVGLESLSKGIKTVRGMDWLVLSVKSIQREGAFPELSEEERRSLIGFKKYVDSLNNVGQTIAVPLSLIKEYGIPALGKVASSIGGVTTETLEMLTNKLSGVSLESLQGQIEVLDTFQKIIGLCIVAQKDLRSLEFAYRATDVARTAAKALGQEEIALMLGIVAGTLGAIHMWRKSESA